MPINHYVNLKFYTNFLQIKFEVYVIKYSYRAEKFNIQHEQIISLFT